MKKTAFFSNDPAQLDYVYGQGRRARLAGLVEMYPAVIGMDNWHVHADRLDDIEAVFSTWGMPKLGPEALAQMPKLSAVFYAAGSVKSFAGPLLEQGITVVSGWGANAVPVAEFTVAQAVLACKGYFRNSADCRDPVVRREGAPFRGRGVFGTTVGLIGLGMVGRATAERLQPYNLEVIAYDPYVNPEKAEELGVEITELEALFDRSYVVSNHLPNLPTTRGLLNRSLFERLQQDATFINTGRGAQVVEADLIEILRSRPDLTALLDVTDPEPPAADSPLYTLPNAHLTSHIAGSLNDEVVRMADYVIEEFLAWERGEPLKYAVTLDMLDHMA